MNRKKERPTEDEIRAEAARLLQKFGLTGDDEPVEEPETRSADGFESSTPSPLAWLHGRKNRAQ